MKDNQSLLKKREKLVKELRNVERQIINVDKVLREREMVKAWQKETKSRLEKL